MPFNINDFKSSGLIYGGARPSLFDVQITTPSGINFPTAVSQKFTFACRGASLPEATVSPIELPYFGRKIKVAGERTYSDWQVTVLNDEDFSIRQGFEAWSNQLNRIVSNTRDTNLISDESYKSTLSVTQYSKDGSKLRQIDVIGAFPTMIGPIQLDWDSGNAIEIFTVNFSYDYWEPSIEQPENTNIKSVAATYGNDI